MELLHVFLLLYIYTNTIGRNSITSLKVMSMLRSIVRVRGRSGMWRRGELLCCCFYSQHIMSKTGWTEVTTIFFSFLQLDNIDITKQ